jgi:acid phosphatase family membrane protein YuiD
VAEVGSAFVTIVPSFRGFSSKLQQGVAAPLVSASDRAGKESGKRFGGAFGGAMKGALVGLTGLFAFTAATNFLKGSIAEAREAQKVGAITAQIIKATGGAAKVSAAQVGALSTAISNKTGVDDEAVQVGANLLLTFKNVRNEAGQGAAIFDRATAAAVDLSKAGFGSIDSASKQLGKALNDPVKGMAALGRAGVTFTEQQKTQIKTLVKSGDVLGAQKIILKEVESQVGGTAAASATMGEKLSVAFGNFKEQVGTALLPLLDKLQRLFLEKIIPAFSQFVTGMQNGTGTGGTFAAIMKTVWSILSETYNILKKFAPVIMTVVAGFLAYAAAVKIAAITQGIFNAVLAANPIGIVIALIAALVVGLVIAYKKSETFRNIVDNAFYVVKVGALTLAKVAVSAFKTIIGMFLLVVSALVSGAAKAFGWVPGLGPKLKAAAANVSKFKDDTNAALAKVDKKLTISLDTAAAKRSADEVAAYYRSRDWSANAQVQIRFSKYGGNGMPGNAAGTDNWRGGPTWVGERGPEIVDVPRGARIIPANKTAAAVGRGGDTYNFNGPVGATPEQVAREVEMRARRRENLIPVGG